jgi:hypothetical protein
MKSELVNYSTASKEIVFPVLAKSKSDDLTILFRKESIGMVVVKNSIYNIGETASDWVSVGDKNSWEILPPGAKVVLENT